MTGPLEFELPHPEIELPEGEEPLVLVAPSTAQDPECELVRRCFEALADEPVRVVATTNRPSARAADRRAGERGSLVDWLSYWQLMPRRDARRLPRRPRHGRAGAGAGTPLLICPSIGDMAENAERVALGRRRADRTEPATQRRDAQVGRPDPARGRSLSATRGGDRGERVVERRGGEGGEGGRIGALIAVASRGVTNAIPRRLSEGSSFAGSRSIVQLRGGTRTLNLSVNRRSLCH